jgi:hypothetical protein
MMLVAAAVLAVVGVGFLFADKIPFLGRLPGDVHVDKKNVSVHFPIVTCIILSIILTIVVNLVLRLINR